MTACWDECFLRWHKHVPIPENTVKTPSAGFLSRLTATALGMATLSAAAGSIDAGTSQITATFRQMNVPATGRFTAFRGTIAFDPRNIASGRVRIEIDTASFDVGAPEYNDELRNKEWFDTRTYPVARFISSSVASREQNRFEATGQLMLKGKTVEIRIPFTMRSVNGLSIFEGELPLSRKTYLIGGADWDDTVEDKVIVKFRIATSAH